MHCRFHLRHGHDLPLTLGKGKRKGAQVHAIFRSEESALELPLRLTKAEDNPWASKKTNQTETFNPQGAYHLKSELVIPNVSYAALIYLRVLEEFGTFPIVRSLHILAST